MERSRLCGAVLALAASTWIALVAHPSVVDAREGGQHAIQLVDAAKQLPTHVKVKGRRVEHAWSWTEPDGKTPGLAVFSSSDSLRDGSVTSRHLYVQIYRGRKQLRLIQDGAGDCDFQDVYAEFVPGAVFVTDADGNGKTEVTFAYDLACQSGEQPRTRKLFTIEAGAKHALRGTSRVDYGGGSTEGGEYTVDGFKNAPHLQSFAEATWKALLGK